VTLVECSREQDVIDALSSGRWPERVAADLKQHVASCQICEDMIAVMGPILADRDSFSNDARIPSSAVMWWRAQMRVRQEAAREVARPITIAQIVGAVCAIAVAATLAASFSPVLREWVYGIAGNFTADGARMSLQVALLSHGWLMPVVIACVWLVLTPLAIYFAVAED
jgi:hypothetical protein